ncbi:MAG TPA: F0F1 ATP synthase subunit B [Alphaproteobacteria bacterium]|nr:F0F1 ATP synthase subunit B [Alphaproteobacteria bacterium]
MFISTALAASEHAAEHGGSLFSEPEFWLAVAFALFVGLLARPVSQKIGAALDGRAKKIETEIEEATRLRDEAQALLASYQRKSREALKEAEDILANAEAEAKRLAEEAAVELAAALKRREQMAVEKIAQAEARAVADVRNAAVDVALAATRELIQKNLDAGKADALVNAAVAELPKKLH